MLLDTAAPIAYIKTTDGNGYANVAAYDLVPTGTPVPTFSNIAVKVVKE